MPQLANDKEITIARDHNGRALARLLHLRELDNAEERYSSIPAAIEGVDGIDPNHLDDPDQVIQDCLYSTATTIALSHKDESKAKIVEAFLTSIVRKIVEIFGTRTKKVDSLSFIHKLLSNKKSLPFYKYTARSSVLSMYYPRETEAEPNQFYQGTVATVMRELLKYHKIVWEVQPRDLIDLVLFVNTLQPAPLHSKEGKELVEAIATELLAYFRSGRPELSRYCGSVSNMRALDEALLKKSNDQSLIRYISQLGPTLAEYFLRCPQADRRKMGLTLMEHYIDEYSYNRYNKSREEEWKAWVNSHEVFEIVLGDMRFCEQMVEKTPAFFRNLKRYKTIEERVRLLVGVLKQDITGCDRLSSFIRKELDYYYMDVKAREVLLEYLSSITNYSAVPYFFETLQELLIRNESDSFIERVYAVITRIMKQDYDKLGDGPKAKCLSAFKYILTRYLPVLKSKNGETKQRILKESLIQLFTDISTARIIIFNHTVVENETWKAYSNNGFQTLLTDLVEKTGFFDNIFKYLQKGVGGRASEKEFVKIIKFVSAKIVSKQDATFRYIHIISKFPEVFEELIDSSGYAQIEDQMRKVFQLFKSTPTTPFHILTLTFERINHTSFLDYRKVPSLLQHRKEQKELNRSPKTLKQFQSLMDLLLETDSVSLRQQLCDYIISLYWNFKQCTTYTYDGGEETFITFLTELLDNFEKDCQQFKDNNSLGKTLLVDMEFIEKALQFTDILGSGDFRPHKSLVSTSTMRLSVTNNVTFGDDVAKTVHRDFPSSMTLFDALTIIGLQFKCGPENIVLIQGGRFISPIFNCYSLEDLNLTNEEIIAEQNTANTLQMAQLFQGKKTDYKSQEKLRPEVIKVITDVFNRFAFEGKMSLIECTNFIRKASGSECISSDRRVKEVFDFDTDNDGIITLPDFIEYYRKNFAGISSYYKDQMLKGLYNLRYKKNLTLYNEPLDISKQHYLMMRFKIAKSYPQLYDIFFKLAGHHQTALSGKAKKLLLFLPSCPKLNAEVSKPIILQDNSQFQIYYKLISIENALSSVQGEAKAARIEQFLKNKNNEVIFGLLSQYHAKAGRSEFEARSLLICLRILRSLINIEQLSTSNPYTRKVQSLSFPHLPPTTFFAEHTAVALQSRNIINFQTLLVLQLTQEHVQLQPIITCCFNHQQDIRKIACHFLYLWSLKTNFALDLFTVPISEHNNEQWFQLLCGVIQQNSALNLTLLKENALNVLQKREESFQNQYDPLMYGYLKILAAIATMQRLESPKLELIFTHLLNNTISQKNRALVFQLIRRQNREIGYGYFDRMLSTILPSQQCLMRQRFVGIKNLGAICYINSILQQFFMVQQFRHMVLSKPVPHDLQPVEVNGRPVVDDFMFQLQKLYHQLEYGKKKYVVPRDFCYAYKNFEGQPINTSIQEDAHQFLNRLIETAEEAFKKEGRLAELQQLLMIKKLSEIECQVCKNRIDKYEQDYCLMIEVKNHDTLVDSLRKFTEQEAIADYFCEKCNKKMAKIYKRTYLNALPQIVILNLQRIVYDQQKGDKVKVHTQLSFPQDISFADFVKNDGPTPPTDYKLKGVVIHTGTSEGGHYYSLVKTKQYGWVKFNDQSVTAFDEKDLERETFGGFEGRDGWGDVNYSTNAYILFYQRANVGQKEFIQAENQFTQQLQKENTRLINQLQIHQESFFQAILASYQAIRPQSLDELVKVQPFIETKPAPQLQKEYLQLIKIGHKAFSFLSVYTEIKQEIRVRMGQMLMELYFMLPEETSSFLKDCNINTYFQNMISDSSQGERETLKQTFLAILLIHIRYYGINPTVPSEQNQLVCDILDKGLSYMQGKLFYSNITKIGAYLSFWDLLARSEQNTCIFLIQKGVLFRMLDLLMGKESAFMKQHPIAQDLPVNLATIVFSCVDKLLEWKLSLKGRKVFPHSCIPTSSLEANILTNHTFYRRIMRLKYDHPSLSNLITHYSYDDLEFSAVIAQFLISSINNYEQINDLPLFFKHINDFLMIKDGLQGVRCGWVLGISQNKECSGKEEEYCLSYSDRSEVIRYISGINFKKTNHLDGRRPLMELAYQKKSTQRQLTVYIIKLLLDLSVESDTVMQFILSMPPPNYFMFSYYDWMPETIGQASKDTELFLEKKMETLQQLRILMEIVKDKIKFATELPVQKHIIGKNKKVEIVGRVVDKDYEFSLRRLTTYVLQNRPTGEQNESMSRKYFSSQSPSGIGHVFVYYRSKTNFESEAKDLKTADTLYILSGKASVRLRLIFKGKLFKHHIITGEGDISIVFPCESKGEIEDLIDILNYQDERVQALSAEVQGLFGAQVKKEEAMEEQKDMMDPALPGGGFQQPKIKCGYCTFDNELTRDRCEMCDNPLFN